MSTATTNPTDALWGQDIALDASGQARVAANGELVLTNGVETGVQDIKLRLFTRLGALFYDLDFGSLKYDWFYEDSTATTRAAFLAEVTMRVEEDPRVVVGSVRSSLLAWDEKSITVAVQWRFIGEDQPLNLVLTADKGMAGSFNQNVLKLLLEKADENDRFYVIGQVGYRALRKDPRLVREFQYGATAPSLQRARDITVDAIDDFKSGKLDEIYLIYTKIQTALTSEPVMVRLLPLDREHLQPAPKGLGDPRGEVELVPDAWTVFEQTAPIYMHGMIFGAMTESFCAEQSARMTAMDFSYKWSTEMIHDLQLEYNRTRQGSITQEITEIIGGAAAVQKRD